jgi:hypothetical protein
MVQFVFAVNVCGNRAKRTCNPITGDSRWRTRKEQRFKCEFIKSLMMSSVNLNEMPSTKLSAILVAEKDLLQNFKYG